MDQANALDYQDCEMNDCNNNEKKREVRNLLNSISARHLKLSSSSVNYKAGLGDELQQIQERRTMVYKGLSKVWLMSESRGVPVCLQLGPCGPCNM